MQRIETMEPEADRMIETRRVISGPRRLVYRAWTDPKHLTRWFGPHGFSTTTRAFEFRPGGVWDFDMHGPDGTAFPNWIEWHEIVPEERITYVQGSRANDPDSFDGRVTFADVDGGTEIVLRVVLASRARREYLIENFNVAEGGRETLERLAGYVQELGTTEP